MYYKRQSNFLKGGKDDKVRSLSSAETFTAENGREITRRDLEGLLAGMSITKPGQNEIMFSDLLVLCLAHVCDQEK